MGGTNSKLHRYLEVGDQEMSAKLVEDNCDLLKSFDANELVNELNETPLLLCCKWSMTSMVEKLLYDCNGDPNLKNVFNQNGVHLVCQIPLRIGLDFQSGQNETSGESEQNLSEENRRRAQCLQLLLNWSRVCQTNKSKKVIETIDVNGLDRNGNTCLHLAATHGLIDCAKILIANKCDIFAENESGDMACDLAAKNCHLDVLRYLQYKMVFSDHPECESSDNHEYMAEENYRTMKEHELEEAKNRLVFETSNVLSVPLSSAEVLLRSVDWSQESLIDNWFNDSNLIAKENHLSLDNNCEAICSKTLPPNVELREDNSSYEFCGICSLRMEPMSAISAKCGHQFCCECWRTYAELKIESGDTSAIKCPAYGCSYLVTMEIIEKVVSPELCQSFVRHDIETFVESNPYIKWCPFPACNTAVQMSESQLNLSSEQSYILANMPPVLPMSHAVECGSGHHFCWECGREAHSPCDCKLWDDWLNKTSDIKAEELKQTYSRTEDAANSLWLVRNAKQCPRCKTHIQKSEGCNHLRCIKCKFDFCWVCLESWKKHNSGTGGYFRCNRSEAAQRAEQNICLLKRVAEAQNCEVKELKKFVTHYTKYKFNCFSAETEAAFLERAKTRHKELFSYSSQLYENGEIDSVIAKDDQFLMDATVEIIRARKVLCGAAVYGYYLEDHGYNKAIFEYMESNLNNVCNQLSDIIESDYLRNSRKFIIDLTKHLKNKRLSFLTAISKGLVPPETPPGLRNHQKKHCLPGVMALDSMESLYNPCEENDKLLKEAVISSLSEYNDKNSWVQDSNGRHNNIYTLYDWPDDCHIDYCDCKRDPTMSAAPTALTSQSPTTARRSESDPEICSYLFCTNPKSKNLRTGKRHDFCSLKCKYLSEGIDVFDKSDFEYDPSMDLLIAIEMSKLSFEEEKRRRLSDCESHTSEDSSDESPFERYVTDIKTNPNSEEISATKAAVMYFLKSSLDDSVDDKNLNDSLNDLKVDKKLFSSV